LSIKIREVIKETSVVLRQVLLWAPHWVKCADTIGSMDPRVIACNCWRRGASELWVRIERFLNGGRLPKVRKTKTKKRRKGGHA